MAAALALLLARERGGEGGYTQVSLAEAAALFAAPLRHGLTASGGMLGGGFPLYGLYPAREGWIALAALEPGFQRRLMDELRLAEVSRQQLERIFLTRTAAEWEEWAQERELPLAAVRETPVSTGSPEPSAEPWAPE